MQQNPSSVSAAIAGLQISPLRPEGWTVRYEYKMACFAEFRGEDEVALKYVTIRIPLVTQNKRLMSVYILFRRHFQDSYNALLSLFTSITGALLARTKRWAEAKVLADCINIKVLSVFLAHTTFDMFLGLHRYASYTCTMRNLPSLLRSLIPI